jgi:putative ABC transport system ATP-binding protein
MNLIALAETSQTVKTTPVIEIHHLDHYFGRGSLRKQVLFDINLEINAGQITIMTGPSGSGKLRS